MRKPKRETVFKTAGICLGVTLFSALIIGILMLCKVMKPDYMPYIYIGIAIYFEAVVMWEAKKIKKDGTNS